ncbi:MAG: PHP domain-containing protein [Muribaculaceae bacterium]|nr:PHP domain-containing protein [Muribaculaceae bacterium]
MSIDIKRIIEYTRDYNLHSHSQFCDGRDPMCLISEAAEEAGMKYFAFTPHSPVPVDSPCNMDKGMMDEYFDEVDRLRAIHAPRMDVYRSLEIDYLGPDFGPHIDYFQHLSLDFRLGSVHFVPNQDGVLLDCDGRYERFSGYLKNGYKGDLRYVVEKYFEQVLTMLERGGLDLLGHFDKIAGNASLADAGIEDQGWYEALVDDVVSHVKGSGVVVEINTKAFENKGRFFPAEKWWGKLLEAGLPLAVDSDVHYASKVASGRDEAFRRLDRLKDTCKRGF